MNCKNNRGFTPLEILKKSRGAMWRKQKSLTGFTLIELLVVVAIIGVLASIVMVSVNDIRARSRDDRRMSDMKTLRDALAMYQIQHSTYPSESTETTITGSDTMSTELLGERLLSSYVPTDPTNTGQYIYTYQSLDNDTSFVIKFCLETSSIKGFSQGCGNQISP